MQKSIDDGIGDVDTSLTYDVSAQLSKTKSICSDDESLKTLTVVSTESNTETKTSPQETPDAPPTAGELRLRNGERPSQSHDDDSSVNSADRITIGENGLMLLPESHPEYLNLIRLQLENNQLIEWKHKLQRRIQNERAEVVRLKQIINARSASQSSATNANLVNNIPDGSSYERIVAHYVLENTLLEQKKNYLAKEIFEENRKLIQLQVEMAIRQFQI